MSIKYNKKIEDNLYITEKKTIVIATGRTQKDKDTKKFYIEAAPKEAPHDTQFYAARRLKCVGRRAPQGAFSELGKLM